MRMTRGVDTGSDERYGAHSMIEITKGRYRARLARCEADLRAAQRLRSKAFFGDASHPAGLDADRFDPVCDHVLVERMSDGALVCCYRFMTLGSGGEIEQSYAAQYYELSNLRGFEGRMVELGRFCIDPDATDPEILRVAWAAMTLYVDQTGVEMLFGCSSFAGTDASAYLDAFAVLKARHLAPKRWLPRIKAPNVFRFAARLRRKPDLRRAMMRMPPLLRTYLMMGGWVSDHAVVDTQMNTLHVFTGVEIGAIPDTRKRLLRAL
jgi:putative hemolysin